MRVISGDFAGRKIKVPARSSFRPTSGRVRGSVFSTLNSAYALGDIQFFDLYAGSGSMGIEALSRGVQKVGFVEQHAANCRLIKHNLQSLEIPEKYATEIVCDSVDNWLCCFKPSDHSLVSVFFVDPPYPSHPGEKLLKQFLDYSLLGGDDTLIIESPKGLKLPTEMSARSGSLKLQKLKRFGDTHVLFYRLVP